MNKIKDYLVSKEIQFKELSHDPVGDPIMYSKKIGSKLEQQAKALLLRCKDKKSRFFIVVALPATKRVDFNLIKKLVGGIKSIRVAEKKDMYEITECLPGELPPLGKPWGLQLYMDKELLNEKEVFFNAGRLDYSIILNPNFLVKSEDAILF